MNIGKIDEMKDYLMNSIVTPEAKEELISYLNEAFNRIIATLDLIPNNNGKLLEVGANPYFLSVLLRKYRNYDCYFINYFGENNTISSQTITNMKYQEKHTFDFININIEKEILPYPDDFFDVVIYCEVIEHLTENPVYSLYNIHRVLKNEGILILSTPNVFRYENLKKYLFHKEKSIYDPYSGYGIYGRHNREYSMYEIADILKNTGFTILYKATLYKRDKNKLTNFESKIIEFFGLGDYLLFKAKKEFDFHWYFPDYLYRGKPRMIITDDYIIIGKNCNIHIDTGWNDIEIWEDIGKIRWTKQNATCYLKPKKNKNKLVLHLFSAHDNYKFTIRILQKKTIISEFHFLVNCGWETISSQLPEITLDPITVELSNNTSWVPQEMGINADNRELGIAIRDIRLI